MKKSNEFNSEDNVINHDTDNILDFYRRTSQFTDLGLYKNFARSLPNDVNKLCILQRMQTIHPVAYSNQNIRNESNCFWGDMTKVPVYRINYEEDYFPTAQSILAELLRRNPQYNVSRNAKDKINITCRGQSILLASILKAKSIPARVRSGFVNYLKNDGFYYDHWIVEYFDVNENIWKLVDADQHCIDYDIGFDLNNIPSNKFLYGAEAYLSLMNSKINKDNIIYTSNPLTIGLEASIRVMFYDFHCLMNNEIIFLHTPKYLKEKDFNLTIDEFNELTDLANLMLEPESNFDKLKYIWKNENKFRILYGGLNDI